MLVVKKNNIKKLQEETLKNILSSKGIIYQHYLRFLQRKHQSNYHYHLECFAAREQLSTEVGGFNGYFPANMQAICMKIETKE